MTHRLYNGDCLDVLRNREVRAKCLFADPPDNIGLGYSKYKDRKKKDAYERWLWDCLELFVASADIVWISFNAKWTHTMGYGVRFLLENNKQLVFKPCVQTFTFGQHSHTDLGNNHRPLWRIMRKDATLYPENIRVPSWRQLNGDKRADPRGRVPGDVFDFTRVVGNSPQRRSWHPTQLNEGLVERCVLFSTKPGDMVLDPFAGTGTTLRVCKRIDRQCTLIEYDEDYCNKIAEEHGLTRHRHWWS